ncbi:ATP-binding cassette domain-containing protein [Curtobacterium sp. Leaf261]|uniref:ATP-binding cassette domain-containing protein n=1 Tax=Curtobacterium sp. Leaf261 TaxID=1736311 RepID=UPI0006F1FA08|nr:ABC transporter ATP-binding protein [Curtobacterium sp. Leaf261]KQO65026.1 lipoprotein ABC transporter ATP-binding protein [Curtobacterium sp. Leaf261]
MIEVRGATKRRGKRTIWADVDLTVARGELLALTGASGSGKSTLLDCIGLIDALDGGTVVLDGRDTGPMHARGRRLARRDLLGYLFQNYALVEDATVEANLDVVRAGATRRRTRREENEEALDRVGLVGRSKDVVHELSGGEQQRVALARLLVKRPRIVLADEPTGALDSVNADMVMTVLREFADAGAAVLVATHTDSVREACDREFSLDDLAAPTTAPVPIRTGAEAAGRSA